MVGQEEAVDDGFFEPFEVGGMGAPGGEYGGEVLAVEGLEEGGAAGGDGGGELGVLSRGDCVRGVRVGWWGGQ